MQKTLFTILLIISSLSTLAQKNFELASQYMNNRDYILADSFYRLHIQEFPSDQNARFNLGITKLYQGDTCGFCNIMLQQCTRTTDTEACKLYDARCEKLDTVYYDTKWQLTDVKSARYTEIKSINKCLEYQFVTIHDKKKKGIANRHSGMNLTKTNIIAAYRLYPDGRKLYTYSLDLPYSEAYNNTVEFFQKSNYIDKAREELKLSQVVVHINYVINEKGRITDIQISYTSKPIEQSEQLMKYIKLIVYAQPKLHAGKFKGENVPFLVRTYVPFW